MRKDAAIKKTATKKLPSVSFINQIKMIRYRKQMIIQMIIYYNKIYLAIKDYLIMQIVLMVMIMILYVMIKVIQQLKLNILEQELTMA